MTKVEFLRTGTEIQKTIDSLKIALKKTQDNLSFLSGIDYSKDRVKASANGDLRLISMICRMQRLENKIKTELDRLREFNEDAIAAILDIKDPRLCALLLYRYIDHCSFAGVAEKLEVSERHVFSLHAKAISMIKIPEKYKKIE